jgi:hypothetical protein
MTKKITGLSVEVLKPEQPHSGVISSKHKRALLIGEGVEGVFGPSEGELVLKLVRREVFGVEHIHAEPLTKGTWAAGGNFVWTCDSRFPNEYPVQIHDYDMSNESKF